MITQLIWTTWTSLSAVQERPLNLITHSLTPGWKGIVVMVQVGGRPRRSPPGWVHAQCVLGPWLNGLPLSGLNSGGVMQDSHEGRLKEAWLTEDGSLGIC